MFILSSDNAISVFFLVVTKRRGICVAICLFFSWLMRRALPACLAAANVGKQMCAHRFNQILAKLWSGEEKDLQKEFRCYIIHGGGNKFLSPKAKRSTWTEFIVSNSKRTYHKSIKQPKVQLSGLNTVMLSVLAGIIWRCCQCLDLIRDGPRPGQIESAHHCSPSAECGFWQTCMRRWFQFALIRRFPPNAANVGGRCHQHDGYTN